MNKRNKSKVQSTPFAHNENIIVFYKWIHGGNELVPGDKILFKNIRGKFTFVKVVENRELGVTWIDCMEDKTHTFRSFYIEKLKGKVRVKVPRKRKVV